MVVPGETEKKVAKDLILDIQFDHFGTRFASASADQHIRVSDQACRAGVKTGAKR